MRIHRERLGTICGAAFILAWFWWFAGGGLFAPFSGDDLMNLHGHLSRGRGELLFDNLRFWSTAYRPMGGLFYVVGYDLFGFDPLPFRVVCFALLSYNLIVLYLFIFYISYSRATAFLAAFLASYHAWFVDLYYSTGTVYELLSFAFYFSAFVWYLRIRNSGRTPAWGEGAGICLVYVCALNSKEMAVTLPLFLLLYEALFHPHYVRHASASRPGSTTIRIAKQLSVVLATGLITLIYVIGKLSGDGSLEDQKAYSLTISPGHFLDTFHLYLNPLLYQEHYFRDPNTIQLLLAMLAIALLLRSRVTVFAWCILLLGILPVAFIGHHAAFFLYFPIVGWVLYTAALLDMARRSAVRLVTHVNPGLKMDLWSTVMLTGALALLIGPLHVRESEKTYRLFTSVQPPVEQARTSLAELFPSMKQGARILIVGAPRPGHEHFLLFLIRLMYHDMTIEVAQCSVTQMDQTRYAPYDAVLEYSDGRLARKRLAGGS